MKEIFVLSLISSIPFIGIFGIIFILIKYRLMSYNDFLEKFELKD